MTNSQINPEEKKKIIDSLSPNLAGNSLEVIKKRYLKCDDQGNPVETSAEMFFRVAEFMASADAKYDPRADLAGTAREFYQILANMRFLPGGRVLFEAGNSLTGQLSSCFVVPIEDSMKEIFDALSNAAVIQKNNGGTGFNFSKIRPRGDVVKGVPEVAAGPIHYLRTFDTALSKVLQGSKRHGGNMGILNVDHPDIEEFIDLKSTGDEIKNFNLSVGVTDEFMEKVRLDEEYGLKNPRDGRVVKNLRARKIFEMITQRAWECADPGVIFLDKLEGGNPTPRLGRIEATNPCGEQPLLPYESCNLGSVVFPTHIEGGRVNWDELRQTVGQVIHFMDNMIDLNNYPLPQVRENVLKTRKIGLGVLGFAQGLYKLGIPYNSDRAVELSAEVMKFIRDEGRKESAKLAEKRGVFPAWKESVFAVQGLKQRNATITTIAPNGTISMVANSSSGVEPVFALVSARRTFFEAGSENKASRTLIFVDPVFEQVARQKGFYTRELMERVAQEGTLAHIDEIPDEVKKLFVTAHDIPYEWHVKMQGAAQKYTDNAVSKTINFPQSASVEDVRRAYIMAYETGCKGITIYRDGSKEFQVLNAGSNGAEKKPAAEKKTEKSVKDLEEKRAVPARKVALSDNALTVLEKRALKKDAQGQVMETPEELFRRVAKVVASADSTYPAFAEKVSQTENNFFEAMAKLYFLPGQALRNAGEDELCLSACFVLPIGDSIEGIMEAMKENMLVHKSTCGTGFNFSSVRSRDSRVGSTAELASGPVSFMKAFNASQDTLKTKGGRKQGSMVILNVDHPDIEEFIKSKQDPEELTNFNISVGLTDRFMETLREDGHYELIDPHTKKVVKKERARRIFDLMVKNAWQSGDPGVIFLDRIEADNPTPNLGRLEATNPCGEQPLLPYETCNLGSINLAKMTIGENGQVEIDWDKLEKVVKVAVHFLDNTIDINRFPLAKMKEMAESNRKIGLGVMGFADLLVELGVSYKSEKAVELAEKVMSFVTQKARDYSVELARRKGSFPNFESSIWAGKYPAMRNAAITTIAPTGYTSIVANCSSGIEPIFALAYKRQNSMGGVDQIEVNAMFEKAAKRGGFNSPEVMKKVMNKGSVQDLDEVPQDIKRVFVTSHDILPEWHLRIQAAFQKYTDNAVSKTINFSTSAKVDDIAKVYLQAYDLGCKGVTIYRDGSKESQVLSKGTGAKSVKKAEKSQEVSDVLVVPKKPRPRPEVTQGATYKIETSYGDLFVTINADPEGNPFEVFAQIGKAGGFFAAKSEAICRMISLALRSGIPASSVIKQLKGIRGPMPSWSKKGMILSIPDAIAKLLEGHLKKAQPTLPLDFEAKQEAAAPTSAKTEPIEVKKDSESTKVDPIQWEKEEFKPADTAQARKEPSPEPVKEKVAVAESAATQSQAPEPTQPEPQDPVDLADAGLAPECPECGGVLEFSEGCTICRSCGFSKCG